MAQIKFLRLPEVINKIGLKRTAIYDRMNRGEFPQSILLTGGRAVVWLESEINDWMVEQVQANQEERATYRDTEKGVQS